MTKSFRNYLKETTREYRLRIKTVAPFDPDRMAVVERLLAKYHLVEIDGPHRTIVQDKPLDFVNLGPAEVWITDIVTAVPVASFVLQRELMAGLGLAEQDILVRSDDDPVETEIERRQAMRAIDDEADARNLTKLPILNSDPAYNDYDHVWGDKAPVFGDAYNTEFLKHLSQVAATRRTTNVTPDHPLFTWLNSEPPIADNGNYNAGIHGAVKPEPWWQADTKVRNLPPTSPKGTFTNAHQTFTRSYADRNGKRIDISAGTTNTRKAGPEATISKVKTRGKAVKS